MAMRYGMQYLEPQCRVLLDAVARVRVVLRADNRLTMRCVEVRVGRYAPPSRLAPWILYGDVNVHLLTLLGFRFRSSWPLRW